VYEVHRSRYFRVRQDETGSGRDMTRDGGMGRLYAVELWSGKVVMVGFTVRKLSLCSFYETSILLLFINVNT